MAKLKDGFYKLTAEVIGSNSYVLLAGGGSKALSDFATSSGVVTALGTNGNYVTWTKNGTTNNLIVPYATNADLVDSWHASYFPNNYSGTRHYRIQFGVGAEDTNWKTIAKTVTTNSDGTITKPKQSAPTSKHLSGSTIKGRIFRASNNYYCALVIEYPFEAIFHYTSGTSLIDTATLYLPLFAKEYDNIRIIKIETNVYELQVRMTDSWKHDWIEFQGSGSPLTCYESLQTATTTGTETQTAATAKILTLDKASYAYNSDTLDGIHADGLLTSLSSNTTNAISITVGGTTKTITASTLKTSLGLGNVQNTAFYQRVTTINGSAWNMAGTTNSAAFTIYAPTNVGTNNQLLKSNGTGAPSWIDLDSITAGKATALVISDIRDTTPTPNNCSDKSVTAWFNNKDKPSTSDTWYSGITIAGWSDGYRVWLLASNSGNGSTNEGLFFRGGKGDTWQSWATVLMNTNSSVSGGGDSWGSSITVNIGGTSKTLTIPSNPNTWRPITDSVSTTDSATSASATAVKSAYDKAVAAYNLANGKTSNTGTVTSVTITQGTGITVSNSGTAITTSGTRTISLNAASSSAIGGVQLGYTASGANIPLQTSSNKGYVALTKAAVVVALGYTPPTSDTNTNYYHTRVYSSGLKISTGTGVSDMYVPTGTTSTLGVVKQHTAADCTSYTSDEGATTPAAVKKAIETFVTVSRDLTSGTKIGTITINGTATELYCQTNTNTDTKVTQTITSSNLEYPLLLAKSGQTNTTTTTAYFDSGVTLNPSTNTITANITGSAGSVAWENITDKPSTFTPSSHSHAYLPLAGGTMNNTGVISRKGYSVAWYLGRTGAMIRTTEYNGYNPILSMKTTNGSWDLGVYTNDTAYLTYITDTDFNTPTNNRTYQLTFPKKTGTIAITTDIPTIPTSLPANGGNSDTVDGYHIVVTDEVPLAPANKTIYFIY